MSSADCVGCHWFHVQDVDLSYNSWFQVSAGVHGRVRNGWFRGFRNRWLGTHSTSIIPKCWEKPYKHAKTTLQKKCYVYIGWRGGLSAILSCKPGDNPGDIAISSPSMLGLYMFLEFPYASNMAGICTKIWGRRGGRTPAIARFVVVCFNWNRPFFGWILAWDTHPT